MPIKPLEQPSEWASNVLHLIGPKVTQPTKIDESGAAPEGHIPGLNFPTTSNEFNSWCNKVSLGVRWLFLGTNAKDQDAHVVESDSAGKVSASHAALGGTTAVVTALRVEENATGDTLHASAVTNRLAFLETVVPFAQDQFQKIMDIRSNAIGDTNPQESHLVHLKSLPASAVEGPGGFLSEIDSQIVGSNDDPLACFTGRNLSGMAALFTGNSASVPAQWVRNEGSGTSLRVGHGHLMPTPVNFGGIALDARGGPGRDSSSDDGGIGGIITGGDAESGGNNKDGGMGLLIRGGLKGSGLGGLGALILSGAGDTNALQLRYNVEPGATAFLLFGETGDNLGGGAHFVCEGAARGIRVESQAGIGLALIKSQTGGGLVNEHIFLDPMEKEPTGTISSGSQWFQHYDTPDIGEGVGSVSALRMRMESIKRAFISCAQGFTCYLRAQVDAFTEIVVDGASDVVIAGAKFHVNDIAPIAGDVLVTFSCEILHNGTPDSNDALIDINITDDTTPFAMSVTTWGTAAVSSYRQVHYSFVYALPAGGQRAFSLGFTKNIIGGTEADSVRMRRVILEIHELRAP